MKHYIVTIETWTGEEEYLMPLDLEKCEYNQVYDCLAEIGFCDSFELVRWEEATENYMMERSRLMKQWKEIHGESVEEGFCSGKYTTLDALETELNLK